MEYRDIPLLTRDEALARISGADLLEKVEALISLAYYDQDWRWVQNLCVGFAYSGDEDLRSVAVLCFGHIARIHGQIDLEIVLPVLYDLYKLNILRGRVHDVLNDIQVFVGFNRKKEDKHYGVKTTN